MGTHPYSRSLLFAGLMALSAPTLAAQAPLALVPLRMEQVMSPSQLEQAGLTRLTREQRLALDAWLTRYSAELRRDADRRSDIMVTAASTERRPPSWA